MVKRVIVIAFVIVLVFTIGVAYTYFLNKETHNNNAPAIYPDVSYKGVKLPYGYFASNELGRLTYTGVVKSVEFLQNPNSASNSVIILETVDGEKKFSFDTGSTLIWLNNSKTISTGEITVKNYAPDELRQLLYKGSIATLMYKNRNSENLPSHQEVENPSGEISVAIMSHSYLSEVK